MTHTNPFEEIHSDLNELKSLIKQIINTPKKDYSLNIYTIKEAAEYFKCSPQTVKSQIIFGNLKAFKIGSGFRIKHDQIFDSNNEIKSLKYKRKA
ncbi:helix-turn-helix domain-containing protein [Flavobacterium yafengii]|uniref:helix-turn-helix domain-containing protein n=1 Tax=Flavobacterium yafengii TaxID=3041253 RepID=UPI0024A99B92|nr:helix-turn-helix domain-containing protein [Flavobacterium yafengii]MDI6046192.1 helix-turn-helix domain-containing protein [Flavobacterium yafengii]